MEYLTSILESQSFPLLSAFILGLMTAISPCPMATNITAVGYISKDIQNRNRVIINGLIYTFGRVLSYSLLAIVLYYSADQIKLAGFLQMNGEKIIGPLLIIIGLFMLDVIKIKFPGLSFLTTKFTKKGIASYWDVLLLGIVFALAFCPYSGVLYFGMLIPLMISSNEGVLLPVVFAVATGIPVMIFAWLIAHTLSGVGKFYNRLMIFEKWFRRIIAVLFLVIGIYYVVIIYF